MGLALQAAVTEELWMRALLFRLLWRAFGPAPALAVVATVFAALHLANPGATALAGVTVAMAGVIAAIFHTHLTAAEKAPPPPRPVTIQIVPAR